MGVPGVWEFHIKGSMDLGILGFRGLGFQVLTGVRVWGSRFWGLGFRVLRVPEV